MSPHRGGRLARLVAALAALSVLAAACGGDDGDDATTTTAPRAGEEFGRELVEEGDPDYGGRLVIALTGETDGWHPTANNWATDGHFVGSAIFETLAVFNLDGTVEPYLAESIEANDDFTEWTITVRDGIRFHDSEPLDAAAVRRNLEVATQEGLTSLTFEGTIRGIEDLDDRTVVVRVEEPWATFDRVLAGVPGYMASPAMLDADDAALRPVGTGPFEFREWTRDRNLVASRFDEYWQTDENGDPLPYLDEIEYRVIVDDQTRMSSLESGDVDMILTTNADDVQRARDNDDTISVEDNFSEQTFVMLNTAVPPFDNEHARRALALATDVDALISTVAAGITTPATTPWAVGTPWEVVDEDYPTYDPEAAADAVAAYTAETGEPLRFEFAGLAQSAVINVQQLLVEQWRQAGIEASIDTLEQTTYITSIAGGDYQAAWFRNYSFSDPDNKYVFWHSKFANYPDGLSINFTQVSDPELDELLDRGRQSGDQEERREIYREVAALWNEHLSNIWLFQTPFALVARPEVKGLNPARELGFGSLQPKPWIGGLWLDRGEGS